MLLRQKMPERLEWAVTSGHNSSILYMLEKDDGRVLLTRKRCRKKVSEYVHPGILCRLAELVREYGMENWSEFSGCTSGQAPVHFFVNLSLTGGEKYLDIAGGSLPGKMPPRYAEAENALFSMLDAVLDAASEKGRPADIQKFYFHTFGMSSDADVIYEVYRRLDPAGPAMVARQQCGPGGQDIREAPADREWMAELENLLNRYAVYTWNGFKGNDANVLDGESFDISLGYAGGASVRAGGYMCFPKNYVNVKSGLSRLFGRLWDKGGAEK